MLGKGGRGRVSEHKLQAVTIKGMPEYLLSPQDPLSQQDQVYST